MILFEFRPPLTWENKEKFIFHIPVRFFCILSNLKKDYPYCAHFGSWKKLRYTKITLCKTCFTGAVLMIQLTRNSPPCGYIGQNPRKRKPRYAETWCTLAFQVYKKGRVWYFSKNELRHKSKNKIKYIYLFIYLLSN